MLWEVQSISDSEERRLPACSSRQPAANRAIATSNELRQMRSASCRTLQAASLRSPDLPDESFSVW